jgi:hypothetical protein
VTSDKQVGTAALGGPDETLGFVILSAADGVAKANPSAESKDPYPLLGCQTAAGGSRHPADFRACHRAL